MSTKKKRITICLETNIYGENYLELIKEITGQKQTIRIVNDALYRYYWELKSKKISS